VLFLAHSLRRKQNVLVSIRRVSPSVRMLSLTNHRIFFHRDLPYGNLSAVTGILLTRNLPHRIHPSVHSFIAQSVLRKVHSLFQSEFSTQYDLVLPLSVSSILSFPGHPIAAYVFFLPVTSSPPSVFSSITCFRRQFLRKMWPIQLPFLLFI
jgi:hypothetical protein